MLVPGPTAESRSEFVRRIIDSKTERRLIVAGPGTGESYLFSTEVARHALKPLLISFLRTLIEEMEPKLGNQAIVRTFHSFCKREFLKLYAQRHPGFRFHFPPIGILIDEDMRLSGIALTPCHDGIEKAMQSQTNHELLDDWLRLAERYQAYGHTDLVYRVLKCFDEGDEVPAYPMVIVDEYQDFSPLERSLIDRLVERSPSLVVGDYDEALYGFKSAGPDGIRKVHADGSAEVFWLPCCSRYTSVVVDAVHTPVERGENQGLLKGRIDKPFVCYSPDKAEESKAYPENHPRGLHRSDE